MKKLELKHGDGLTSVLYHENRFYLYERDKEKIYERFGGCNYYSSRSGLTGAGYIESTAPVSFGVYRTECYHQAEIVVAIIEGAEVFGYYPFTRYTSEKTKSDYPVVLTDGEKIVFSREHDVEENIRHWSIENEKECSINVDFYKYNGEKLFKKMKLTTNKFCGVNALRFLEMRKAQKLAGNKPQDLVKVFERISYSPSEGLFYNENALCFLDCCENSLESVMSFCGWERSDSNVYFRYQAYKTELVAIDQLEINGILEFVLYEDSFNRIGNDQNLSEKIANECLQEKIQEKLSRALAEKQTETTEFEKWEKAISWMQENKKIKISAKDSYLAENCEVGTISFCNRYNLNLNQETLEKILENKDFPSFSKREDFRKVIYRMQDMYIYRMQQITEFRDAHKDFEVETVGKISGDFPDILIKVDSNEDGSLPVAGMVRVQDIKKAYVGLGYQYLENADLFYEYEPIEKLGVYEIKIKVFPHGNKENAHTCSVTGKKSFNEHNVKVWVVRKEN